MRASFMSSNRANVQQATKGISRFLSESNKGVCSIECVIRDVKATRVDTDSDHAGCVLSRKSTTRACLFHGVNLLRAGRWTQGTRSLSVTELEFYAGVKGASFLFEAKSMMMIAFGHDVGQCVVGTDSSSIKSAVERHMLWLQERVDSGGNRTENWRGEYNIADSATKAVSADVFWRHFKTLRWSGARYVISWRYVQWCGGLSEAARRALRSRRMEKQGGIFVCYLKAHRKATIRSAIRSSLTNLFVRLVEESCDKP